MRVERERTKICVNKIRKSSAGVFDKLEHERVTHT